MTLKEGLKCKVITLQLMNVIKEGASIFKLKRDNHVSGK